MGAVSAATGGPADCRVDDLGSSRGHRPGASPWCQFVFGQAGLVLRISGDRPKPGSLLVVPQPYAVYVPPSAQTERAVAASAKNFTQEKFWLFERAPLATLQ